MQRHSDEGSVLSPAESQAASQSGRMCTVRTIGSFVLPTPMRLPSIAFAATVPIGSLGAAELPRPLKRFSNCSSRCRPRHLQVEAARLLLVYR